MSENDNREFVRNFYAAAAAGDVAAMTAAMDDDIVVYQAESLPYGGEHRGPEASLRLVETISRYVDFSTLEMRHFLVEGDLVMALGSMVWRGIDGDQEIEMPFGELWEIRGGRFVSARPFYFDTAAMVAAQSSESL